jgi:hypothetical protein
VKSEIDQRATLEAWLRSAPRSNEVVLQGLDLTSYEEQLLAIDLRGCVFVGCRMSSALAAHAAASLRRLNTPTGSGSHPRIASSCGTRRSRKKVFPLPMQLAAEAKFEHLVRIADSVDEIVDFIRNPP